MSRRSGGGGHGLVTGSIAVNVCVQVGFAFLLPLVMEPELYFSCLWPLDWYELQPGTLGG